MLIGYARVSTEEQTTALQIDALTLAGCHQIFKDEGVSGALRNRPALDQAVAYLKPGDTLVTWRLDRLGRSLSHLIMLVTDLEARGVGFKSITEAIDTRTAAGRLLFHVMGALAEFERTLISERTRAGMIAAAARGKTVGRPVKLSSQQADQAAADIQNSGQTIQDAAKELSVSPNTLRRAISRSTSSQPGASDYEPLVEQV